MRKSSLIITICIGYIMLHFACSKPPAFNKYPRALGQVIAKENCTGDEATEYWLVDLNNPASSFSQYDTITFSGVKINVIKVIIPEISKEARQIGKRVAISVQSTVPYQPVPCMVTSPQTFAVKSVAISNEGMSVIR